MACNCGGSKAAPVTYVHTDKNGNKTAYSTKTEAEAARVRTGGSVKST